MTDDASLERGRVGARIRGAVRELRSIESSDPAATRSLHAVRLVEHTLRCHGAELDDDG